MAENNGSNSKAKRKRSANWHSLEKSVLRTCLDDYLNIIENKNTDTNTNTSKSAAWQKVMQRFNELNNRKRDLADIKQQWRTMKRKLDAKNDLSQVNQSIRRTGGGSKPPNPSPDTLEIRKMIPLQSEDSNAFDSDSYNIIVKDTEVKERNDVLIKCLKEEHQIKIKHLIEVHTFQKEEHKLKIENQELLRQETLLRIQKLNLEIKSIENQTNNN